MHYNNYTCFRTKRKNLPDRNKFFLQKMMKKYQYKVLKNSLIIAHFLDIMILEYEIPGTESGCGSIGSITINCFHSS